MKQTHPKHIRILAIAPSTRGFGFAVLEEPNTLVDWGVKSVKGDKNAQSLVRVKDLIALYLPGMIVLEDPTKHSRRSARIQELVQLILGLASNHRVRVKLISREQLRRLYFADGSATKHARAVILAQRFPEELGSRLPPKRRPWMSEDYRMDIFDAVALALVLPLQKARRLPR